MPIIPYKGESKTTQLVMQELPELSVYQANLLTPKIFIYNPKRLQNKKKTSK